MILVGILSYRRPNYLARTIESFIKNNEMLFGAYLKMIALDQCSSETTMRIFEEYQCYFEKLYAIDRNVGIGWGFSQLVELSQLHEANFILALEDDWLCQTSLAKHLESILRLFQTYPNVGMLRLRSIDDPVATVNHVTYESVETKLWQENFFIGNYHYVFNPHLVRTEVARAMIPVSGEHHAQMRYQTLDLKIAQLIDTMFIHIGEKRAPGRISRLPTPEPVIPYTLVTNINEHIIQLPFRKDVL